MATRLHVSYMSKIQQFQNQILSNCRENEKRMNINEQCNKK